jgi:MFS family permease
MLLARSKPAIFLPSIMVTWGAVSIIVAAIHNLAGMVAFRFALGIIEAGFFPGVVSPTRHTRGTC